MKTASVVIVSYHTGAILMRCLESVLRQEGLAEVILVDNGNPPEVLERLQHFTYQHQKLRIITGHGNIGFAKGCNLGAENTTGDYILLLNPDSILPTAHTVKEAIAAMERHPEAWLGGVQMVDADLKPQGGSKRHLLTPWIALSQVLHLYRFGNKYPSVNIPESPEEHDTVIIPAISGAFMLLPRERYHALGGLDEGYFFHVEDLDLCQNIANAGGKVLYIPSVKILHYRSSSKVSSVFIERHKTAGFIRYFRKHWQKDKPFWIFWLVVAGIYARLGGRMVKSFVLKPFSRRRAKYRSIKRQRQLALLAQPVPLQTADYHQYAPVLVAGSTGQVGLNVLHHLLGNGIETFGLFHQQVLDYHHPKLHWVQGNLMQQDERVNNAQPRTLVHTPALWLLPPQLEKFAACGVRRVVAFSTTSIMGKADSSNPYEQKVIRLMVDAERDVLQECDRLGIACTILRPTMIYGCGLDHNVSAIVRFIESFGFFPVVRPSKGLREPVHVDDLAQAVMACMANPATSGKIYNLGGGEQLSYRDMVKRIFSQLGRKNRTLPVPCLPLALDVFSLVTGRRDTNGEIARRMNNNLVFNSTPAQQDFGYTPRGFLADGKADLGMA